jgi:hypothetical protein
MEEAHDAIAEVGNSNLSEDELFHRFLEQELAAAAAAPGPETAPPPRRAAAKADLHQAHAPQSDGDWGTQSVKPPTRFD